jgi:hypothetical protein
MFSEQVERALTNQTASLDGCVIMPTEHKQSRHGAACATVSRSISIVTSYLKINYQYFEVLLSLSEGFNQIHSDLLTLPAIERLTADEMSMTPTRV